MSLLDYQKLRNYITEFLKEGMLHEAAASAGLAALLARALADKILEDVDRIGFLYVTKIGKDRFGKTLTVPIEASQGNDAIAYNIFPKQKEYSVLATALNKPSMPNRLRKAGSYYLRAISRGMFENYGGDFIVLGNSYYDDAGFPPGGLAGHFEKYISEYESIGQSFLSNYVTSEENKKKILDVFESEAAVGYFAAQFIVVITQAEAQGSRGHVSSNSAAGGRGLVILNNAMTVTRESSSVWQLGWSLLYGEQLKYIEKNMDLPIKLGTRIKVNPRRHGNNALTAMIEFDNQIKRIVAAETTYIHELQHLIQHAGYQTPSSQLDPKSAKEKPISSPQNPMHPYNNFGMTNTDTARLAGLAKSKRPPAQHVKIVSQMLQEMNIIKGSEIGIDGVNSPAFEVEDSFFDSARLYLSPGSGGMRKRGPHISLVMQAKTSDASLAEQVVKYISDTYLSSLPSAKKPEERESQLKRFGSARGKKSVARKYRLFIADILADIGTRYYQSNEFDTTDQIKADMGLGPRDVTVPDALAALKKNKGNAGKKYSDAITRLNKSLVNKGGVLSKKLIEQTAKVFPTMVFYSRKLDIFIGRGQYSQHRYIDQPFFIEFLEEYDFSDDLIAELKNALNTDGGGKAAARKLIDALDLVLVIAQSGADVTGTTERKRLESQAGMAGRVSKGYSYSGSAWYQRANGYVWRRLQTEYDAEFVTGTAGLLYGLYIIGTEDKTNASRILAPTYLMDSFERPEMSEFMFALLEEDIPKVATYIKQLSKKSRQNFQGYIDRELVKQKSDQYRRLAIDMIDKIQNISDEELTDIKVKAIDASVGKLYNSPAKKATQNQIDALTPEVDDFLAGKNKDRSTRTLPKNIVMGIIGYVGRKLLE